MSGQKNGPGGERWDLLDAAGRPLGKTVARGAPHPAGSYHAVAGLLVLDAQNRLLLTLRDSAKAQYPDLWENPGGCVRAGERPAQAACRELAEETGIGAAETALTLLSTLVERTALVFTYALRAAPPAGGLRLQPGETSAARWVTRAELTALAESGALSAASARRLAAARAPLDAFLAGRPTAPVYAVLPNENLTPSG